METRLAEIQKRFEENIRIKADEIYVKKLKEKMKKMKLAASQQKVIVENHVGKKNYEHNFHGVSNMFEAMFGT